MLFRSQANTFLLAGPGELSADAGAGLGVGYDVVIDIDRDGTLSDPDYIDGAGGETFSVAIPHFALIAPAVAE